MDKFKSVDDYISAQPPEVAVRLRQVREIIHEEAKDAEEKISYGIPFYNLNGRLVYFAAFKNHIGLYPLASGVKKFSKELEGFKFSKGAIQFPLDNPLPVDLIRKIVKFRTAENISRTKT